VAVQTKSVIACFVPQQLEAICRVLADTEAGLTGSEIGYLLRDCQIPDSEPAKPDD